MATTTAAVTLSSDLMQDALSVNTDTTLMKAGTTADGLDQVRMGYNKIPTGTSFDLLDATAAGADKAAKVLIANESEDPTYYVTIVIDAKTIGRLYAGDWMFIPWNQDDATHDLEVTATTGTNTITWMAFHEGETLPTQAD
tara:strand:- start:1731 stop:2153 length:423 start_codon:yes stop_codon:yes gene_type:complete